MEQKDDEGRENETKKRAGARSEEVLLRANTHPSSGDKLERFEPIGMLSLHGFKALK